MKLTEKTSKRGSKDVRKKEGAWGEGETKTEGRDGGRGKEERNGKKEKCKDIKLKAD